MKAPMMSLAEALRDFEESGKFFERQVRDIPIKPPPPSPPDKGLLAQIVERTVALIAAGGLMVTGGALKACSKGLANEGSALFRNGAARVMETDIGQNINRTIGRAWKEVGGGFFRRSEMRIEPPSGNIKESPKISSNATIPFKIDISGLLPISRQSNCSKYDALKFRIDCELKSLAPGMSPSKDVLKKCEEEAKKLFPCVSQ